jgi:hypothetical protein
MGTRNLISAPPQQHRLGNRPPLANLVAEHPGTTVPVCNMRAGWGYYLSLGLPPLWCEAGTAAHTELVILAYWWSFGVEP